VNIITEEFYPGYLTEKKSILFKKDYQHFLLVSLFCLFVFKKKKRKRKGRKNIAIISIMQTNLGIGCKEKREGRNFCTRAKIFQRNIQISSESLLLLTLPI